MCLLYLYSFEYKPADDGLVEAEICRRHIINDKLLLIIYCVICRIKYYISRLLQGLWVIFDVHVTVPP
jgi:hypothetical protein